MDFLLSIINIITTLIIAIFGSIMFYKSKKRLSEEEANLKAHESEEKEITNLKQVINQLIEEVSRQAKKCDELERKIDDRDKIIEELRISLSDIDLKYYIKKQALTYAIGCDKGKGNCPALLKMAELEESYNIRRIEKGEKNESNE
jgi:uncharacterized protein HemX